MAQLDILGFSHIGFVVESIDAFRATWDELLGLDDWIVREVALAPHRVQLHGELIEPESSSRIAFTKFQGTSLELVEPVRGDSLAADWIRTRGTGVNHIGVWVRDLRAQLDTLHDRLTVTYSPATLHPTLANRPLSVLTSADSTPLRPPFWAYVDPHDNADAWQLELLDARFANEYREYYGDRPYYPGELPDTDAYRP